MVEAVIRLDRVLARAAPAVRVLRAARRRWSTGPPAPSCGRTRPGCRPCRVSSSHLALVDEIGFVPPGAGDGADRPPRQVGRRTHRRLRHARLRQRQHAGADAGAGATPTTCRRASRFVEYAAEPGCDVHDRAQWRKANPALRAGLPTRGGTERAGADHARARVPGLPPGPADRVLGAVASLRRLGQLHPRRPAARRHARWCSPCGATTAGRWPSSAPRSTARCSSAGMADKPTDQEVAAAIRQAADQWTVLEVCHKPHIRSVADGRARRRRPARRAVARRHGHRRRVDGGLLPGDRRERGGA